MNLIEAFDFSLFPPPPSHLSVLQVKAAQFDGGYSFSFDSEIDFKLNLNIHTAEDPYVGIVSNFAIENEKLILNMDWWFT